MCLTNAVPEQPFYGISMTELTGELYRLSLESDIKDKKLERFVQRDLKIDTMFKRMKRIIDSKAESQIKVAIFRSMLERVPPHEIPNPER